MQAPIMHPVRPPAAGVGPRCWVHPRQPPHNVSHASPHNATSQTTCSRGGLTLLATSKAAPARTSRPTAPRCPSHAALCKGVNPNCSSSAPNGGGFRDATWGSAHQSQPELLQQCAWNMLGCHVCCRKPAGVPRAAVNWWDVMCCRRVLGCHVLPESTAMPFSSMRGREVLRCHAWPQSTSDIRVLPPSAKSTDALADGLGSAAAVVREGAVGDVDESR
jgi:hypothetical protein